MNGETHDDSSYVLDRAITYYRGWSIERRQAGPYVISSPTDQAVDIAFSLSAAREAIDAAIDAGIPEKE